MTRRRLAHIPIFVTLILPVIVICGCFQAENAFYREKDIVTDKRLHGRFRVSDTNSSSSLSVAIEPAAHQHYMATVSEGDKWIKLDSVLFKCETNLFLDISRISDNGTTPEPGVGPSALEMLQMATVYKTHSVLEVRFTEKGFQLGASHGNPVYYALQKYPSLKFKKTSASEPVDPYQRIITNPTRDLFKFLQTVGTNYQVFQFNGEFIRSPS
jgi:hypothetical protein